MVDLEDCTAHLPPKKFIVMSVKPKWVAKILNGEKTIEIRKTMPKCDLPIDVYIYCTKEEELFYNTHTQKWFVAKNRKNLKRLSNGVVIAKFTLNKVEEIKPKIKLGLLSTYGTYETETLVINPLLDKCCLSFEELDLYLNWNIGYAWHIDNLEIFDKSIELDRRPPMSWCYIER